MERCNEFYQQFTCYMSEMWILSWANTKKFTLMHTLINCRLSSRRNNSTNNINDVHLLSLGDTCKKEKINEKKKVKESHFVSSWAEATQKLAKCHDRGMCFQHLNKVCQYVFCVIHCVCASKIWLFFYHFFLTCSPSRKVYKWLESCWIAWTHENANKNNWK